MRTRSVYLETLALLGLLAACARSQPEPAKLNITMTEFAFTPDFFELKVGQEVTITLDNQGQLDHEIMFGREVTAMNGHPSGYSAHLFEVGGATPFVVLPEDIEDHAMEPHGDALPHSGFTVVLPGEDHQATIKFTITEEMVGEWEIGCFLQEGVHYLAGMTGRLIIKP